MITSPPDALAATDIWLGWRHLDGPSVKLGDLEKIGETALLPGQLSADTRAVLCAIRERMPTLLPSQSSLVEAAPAEFEALIDQISDMVEPNRRFVVARRFLEVVDAGNQVGRFAIPIPRLMAPPPPEPGSPFQYVDFERMIDVAPLVRGFTSSLSDTAGLDSAMKWGRLLLAAMLFGGLTRPDWLLVIPSALRPPADDRLRWLDLTMVKPVRIRPKEAQEPKSKKSEDNKGTQPIIVLRRWFPDPISRILLKRMVDDAVPDMPTKRRNRTVQVEQLVRTYARHTGIDHLLPNSFTALAAVVRTRMHLHMPPYLVAYAFEKHDSVSLSADAWRRIVSPPDRITVALPPKPQDLGLPPEAANDKEPSTPDSTATPEAPLVDGEPGVNDGSALASTVALEKQMDEQALADEEEWPRQLRVLGILVRDKRPGKKDGISLWRKEHAASLIPSIDRLAEWVEEYLLVKGPDHSILGGRTIYQWLRVAGRRLVALLGRTDPAALGDEDAYIELYESVLEDIESAGYRRKAATALLSFHKFLVKKKSAPELSVSGIFSVHGKGGSRVDANLIGIHTYFLGLNFLQRVESVERHTKPVIDALCRIAGLGFFCGLRRSEAIGLRLTDVMMGGDETYLTIKPNALRALKTDNAKRRFPLHVLMTPAEHSLFRQWVTNRLRTEATSDCPLFPEFVRVADVRDNHSRLALIVEAVQAATGDPTMRFHHLRHSFASWQLVKYWLADQLAKADALPSWFLPTSHDRARWETALAERLEVLGEAPTNRRALMQVSALLGHGSVDITLGSYIHVLDFLLGLSVRRMTPRVDADAVAAISGLPLEQVQRMAESGFPSNADDPQAQWMDTVADSVLGAGKRHQPTIVMPKVAFGTQSAMKAPIERQKLLQHQAAALNEIASGKSSVSAVAERFGLDCKVLAAAWRRFQQLPAGIAAQIGGQPGFARAKPTAPECLGFDLPEGKRQFKYASDTVEQLDGLRGKRGAVQVGPDFDPIDIQPQAVIKRIDHLLLAFPGAWVPGTYLNMRFASVPDAKRWIWFLGRLKLANSYTVIHTPSSTSGSSARRQYTHWQDALKTSTAFETSKVSQPGKGFGSVEISMRHGRGGADYERITVLTGVRLALAMLYVDREPYAEFRSKSNLKAESDSTPNSNSTPGVPPPGT